MGRIHRSKAALEKNPDEGTAARTRPFSFEEIMLRREKKLTEDGKQVACESMKSSEKDDSGSASDHSKSDGGCKGKKESKDIFKGSYKKIEEKISKREGDHLKVKEKGNRYVETIMKAKSRYDKNSRDKDIHNEKQIHHRRRTDDRLEVDFEEEFEKKRSKDAAVKDKHGERDRKSKKEGKRKHHGYTDERSRSEIDGSILKKHDSGKMRDTKYSERRDRKKDSSQSYYEELRSKRRRSRSREYDRDRDMRSVSVSPRAHKLPYHGRDHEESSFHSFKDKSGRKHSDADKYRISGNGGYSSGHYRKHGSGLGGYSPRKRRSEAAIKTPSPTARSPERKSATWDLHPAGTTHAGSGVTLANQSSATNVHEMLSSIPVTSATDPHSASLQDTASTLISTSIESIQLTQATRPLRRLYIENLPPSASDKTVIDCLNDLFLSSGVNRVKGTKPCISCIINKEKCQALVEFLTPEDATAALSFDGKSFSGSFLKIRRPKDFVDAATGAPEKPVAVVNEVSDVVKDSPHKIFIGGISKNLSSDMLIEIVSAFGLLRAYHFEFNEELNGPCAFLEYIDQSITLKACAGLNGMKLGGHVLTAVQAFPSAPGEEEKAECVPTYGIPEHAKPLLANSTQVLQLKNVFNREEFFSLSEPELEETLEDIRLECARFGTIKSVNIVRYNSSNGTVTEASEQDPNGDTGRREWIEESCSSDSKQNGDMPPPNDKEFQDAREENCLSDSKQNSGVPPPNDKELEDTNCSDEKSMEDLQKEEPTDPFLVDGATRSTTCEEPIQLDPTGDPSADLDKDADVKVEEGPSMENGLVPEQPKPEEMDTELVEDTTPITAAVEKADVSNEDGKNQTSDADVFEPGCVLVEFLRKEASCMAAYCLHGRFYGERVVAAGYVPHNLYLARFPR